MDELKILVDENIPQGREAFHAFGEVHSFSGRKLKNSDVLDCDILIVRSVTKVNESLLHNSRVQFVGTATIGEDHIDKTYLAQRGIGFSSAPGCNANSVAEYVLSALLWLGCYRGLAWRSSCLGIVGKGHVGSKLCHLARRLGMRVLVSDPPLASQSMLDEKSYSLQELRDSCDIISAHVPLVREGAFATKGMFNKDFFHSGQGKNREPFTFINSSRGDAVDETALLAAQSEGQIKHLILDVFQGEPQPNPELFQHCDLVSPHIAGYSIWGKYNGTAQMVTALAHHLDRACPAIIPAPLPSNQILRTPETMTDAEAVLTWAVFQVYDIGQDDADLRLAQFFDTPAQGFDDLRRTYRQRNEFGDYLVIGKSMESVSLCARAGFQVADSK